MENLKKKIQDLEEELKSKQNSILWVHQTYQDIIRDTSKVHEYVSSLLKTYDFDKHSKKIEKEVFGSIVTEPPKDNSKVESKPDNLENEEMEVEEPVQRTNPDMLQDGAKFQQYLSSLLTTLTNACSFVENLEKLRKEVNENHQERIRSMKDDYESKIEKLRKSSTGERLSQVDEISALKDKILEQLEFELNELRREKENMTKRNSENGKEICKLKEDLEKKEVEISELKEKLVSKEKEIFEKDRIIKDLGKEIANNSKTIEPVITCDASTSTNSDNEKTTEGENNPEAVVSDMSTDKNDSEVVENSKATSNAGNGEIKNETNDPKIVVSEMSLSVAKNNPKVVIKDCRLIMDRQNDPLEDSFATHNSSSPGSPFSPMVLRNHSSPMVSDTSIDDTNDSSNHDDSLISDEDSSEPLSDSDSSPSSRSDEKENANFNILGKIPRNAGREIIPRFIFYPRPVSSNDSLKDCGPCPKACKSCHKPMKVEDCERPFTCTYCNKKYKTRNTLKIHQLIHTANKLHCCTLCPKSFYRKDHLTQHKAVHSDEKPFGCELCGKFFKQKSGLRGHEVTHEIKRFSCPICYKRFRNFESMEKHRVLHVFYS